MTEFRLYLRIARKWWWLILVFTLLASGAGWIYASTIPPVYQASASLLVSARSSADDYGSVMASEKMAETYKELLTKRPVIEQAAHALGLEPDQIASKVESRLIPKTLIIELVVKDPDPGMTAAIANSMVMAFMDTLMDAVSTRPRDIAVVELATPPAAPVSPQITRIVVVTGLAGFVLAAGVAFGIEFARDPLESAQDVRRTLSLPTLTAVPSHRRDVSSLRAWHAGGEIDGGMHQYVRNTVSSLRVQHAGGEDCYSVRPSVCRLRLMPLKPGFAVHRQPRMPISLCAPDSPVTEAYRTLRTWIQFSYQDAPLPTLLVTSPVSRKDTVHVATNLGVVLAQAGLKAVLLDADLRQPALQQMRLCQAWDLSAEPGLSALLASADDWPEYVVETDIPGLHLIPGGLPPVDPLGLLSSPRMDSLIRQLERRFQVLLIHAPPILVASDALVLAPQVTGTVLVIESGATSRSSAIQALTLLENAEASVLGTVLTRARTRSPESGSYSDIRSPGRRTQPQVEAETSLAWLDSGEIVGTRRL